MRPEEAEIIAVVLLLLLQGLFGHFIPTTST